MYLIEEMKISASDLSLFPEVYQLTSIELENRNQYLESCNKNQYNPKMPNFIPLSILGLPRTYDFLHKLGGDHSMQKYCEFLKTL